MSVSPQSEHDDLFDDEPVGNGPEPNGEGGVKAEERKDADLDDLVRRPSIPLNSRQCLDSDDDRPNRRRAHLTRSH
jgi:hypothetical protein